MIETHIRAVVFRERKGGLPVLRLRRGVAVVVDEEFEFIGELSDVFEFSFDVENFRRDDASARGFRRVNA
jgi:hypothetical protein